MREIEIQPLYFNHFDVLMIYITTAMLDKTMYLLVLAPVFTTSTYKHYCKLPSEMTYCPSHVFASVLSSLMMLAFGVFSDIDKKITN